MSNVSICLPNEVSCSHVPGTDSPAEVDGKVPLCIPRLLARKAGSTACHPCCMAERGVWLHCRSLLQIPWAVANTAVIYNLPGVLLPLPSQQK